MGVACLTTLLPYYDNELTLPSSDDSDASDELGDDTDSGDAVGESPDDNDGDLRIVVFIGANENAPRTAK
jgi:hypothetical protein